MLFTSDLKFSYPDELVATEARPRGESRVLWISRDRSHFEELSWPRFLAFFKKGDTLVLNDSKVLWSRLLIEKSENKLGEILFLKTQLNSQRWEVMTGGLNLKVGKILDLPGGVKAEVLQTGRVAVLQLDRALDLSQYLSEHGEVPLPPYITSLRGTKKTSANDKQRYQTLWAEKWGSVAAPTSGLHFTEQHLKELREKGVKVVTVTLHVSAGTFMPIDTEKLEDFQIHSEYVEVSKDTCDVILKSKAGGHRVWACGTTALRALEAAVWASGTGGTNIPMIAPYKGYTNLFVTPGYKFQVVDALLTNFHQPESSLLALVSAFATAMTSYTEKEKLQCIHKIKEAYDFAIAKKFRLFSYGDLTVVS